MKQVMINEINGIITYMSPECKGKIPEKMIKYFKMNSNKMPNESIDLNKPLKDQNLDNQTILILAYINKMLKK